MTRPRSADKDLTAPFFSGAPDSDDEKLLSKARTASNGARFAALWSGDTSEHGGDHSAADLALCNILAFWTESDAVRMDRLFRQSGLMRPKWDEKRGESATYGQMTIAKAIESTCETYRAKTRNGNRPYPKQPSQPSQPSQAHYHLDNQENNFSKSGTGGDFEAVPAVPNRPNDPEAAQDGTLRPYFFMLKSDKTHRSTRPDLAKQHQIDVPGLYFVPVVQEKDGKITRQKHGAPVWISIPFDLLATTDDGQGHGHGVALRFDSIQSTGTAIPGRCRAPCW
ncbi:MAG TPA: hypothetical protein PKY50_19250 [Candidatus Competibacter sp.]|nr:hypothetical protein [Candidatus Competibacter sp.]